MTDLIDTSTTGSATPIDSDFTARFDAMLRARRSSRDFVGEPLDQAEIDDFLDVVMTAPSAFNVQDRAVVVVSDPEVRSAVHRAANQQVQVAEAPLVMVFLAEPHGWEDTYDEIAALNVESGYWSEEVAVRRRKSIGEFQRVRREAGLAREFAVRNAMIPASFAILAAEARGWGASPMTGFDEDAVKEAIGAGGTDVAVALLLAVGPVNSRPGAPSRLPQERRVYRDRYLG